jgi:hypothetical protein
VTEHDDTEPRTLNSANRQPTKLNSRQRAVLEGLVNFGPKDGPRQLGEIYQGVLSRLADQSAPDGAACAAHGARELMEKLAWHVNDDSPEDRGSLGDRVREIEAAYQNLVKVLPPERARWNGLELTPEVMTLLDAVEHMEQWRKSHTLSRGAHAALIVDFSIGRIPEQLRAGKRKQWMDLREFFTKVAHHGSIDGRTPTLADVAERFTELEDFLYARWAPRTVRDFAEIDALIAPQEDE